MPFVAFYCAYVHACSVMSASVTPWIIMDHRLPDSSVHGILQTRMLEWVAISYSKEPSQPRDQTHVSCISYIDRWILYHCIPPGKLLFIKFYLFDKKFFFYIWNVSTTQNTRETVLFELSVVFVPFCAIQEALVSSVPKFWLLLILSSFILVLSTSFHVKFEMYPNLYSKIAFWTF